jgi:YVTN family beta-propeller protein
VPIGKRPSNVAITPNGKRVYICIREESGVDIVDTASLEKVKSVPVGKNPHNVYMSTEGKWMIATSMGEDKLTGIDINTEEPVFAIPVGGIPRRCPDGPPGAVPLIPRTFSHGMAISPDRKTLWVDSLLDNS